MRRKARTYMLSAAFAALAAAAPAAAQMQDGAKGPTLGAVSNLAQGRGSDLLDRARSLGVRDLRDGMRWERAEQQRGVYDFSDPRLSFPSAAGAAGMALSVVLNWGNPLYDDGDTPYTEGAVDAFGRFAGVLVGKFPEIASLEIGNEFNGVNFVRGPIKQMSPGERARAYVPLLAAAATAARKERPAIRILGGATHSMAAGYIWEVLDAGGARYLDALAIHPYTTPAEQLVRQVAVLRRHPEARSLPIEVTEFGDKDAARAGDHFLRNYCQMALSGVTRAVWFPLNERNDGFVALFKRDGTITTAGQAFQLAAARMEGRAAVDAASDPFTFGCRFGEDVLVLWGEPRAVEVDPDVEVLDSQGVPLSPPFRLSAEAPLVFIRKAGGVQDAVHVAPSSLVADSFYQFAYPQNEEAKAEGDAFERFARRAGKEFPLETMPGQEQGGAPWFPYRGNPKLRQTRLTAEVLLPGGGQNRPLEIVHRYVAPTRMIVDVDAHFTPNARSQDGVAVTVYRNSEVIFESSGKDTIQVDSRAVELDQGDTLEFVVGPNGTPMGDLTDYRIRLLRSGQ